MFDCSKCVLNQFYKTREGLKAEYLGKRISPYSKECYYVFYVYSGDYKTDDIGIIERHENGSFVKNMNSPNDVVGEWKEPLKVGDKVALNSRFEGYVEGEVIRTNVVNSHPILVLWTYIDSSQSTGLYSEDYLKIVD